MDLIQSEGYQADCSLLDIGIIPADSIAGPLEIYPQTQVISIERLFLADSLPVIYSTNFVAFELVQPDRRETVISGYNCADSIYEFLQQRCNSKVYNQKSEVRAVLADEKKARLLNCSAGDPLLTVEEVGFGLKMKPIFYGVNHFRGDIVRFAEMRHPTVWLQRP
jgi:DNA-binding GntR family transcriptional regulator